MGRKGRVNLVERELPSGKRALYLDYRHAGERVRENLKMMIVGDRLLDKETRRMADLIRTDRERELQFNEHGLKRYKKSRSFIEYFEGLIEAKNSTNTRLAWEQGKRHFVEFAGEIIPFSDIDRAFLERYKTFLLTKKKLSLRSAQVYFSFVKSALNQAVREEIIPSNPAAFISFRKVERIPTFLSIAEVRLLARTPIENQHIRNAFLFSTQTGLRLSDVFGLSWDMISDGHLRISTKKTGKAENLPLSPEAQSILEAQKAVPRSDTKNPLQKENAIFTLPGQPTIDKTLKRWAKRAKLEKTISFHVARHSFAVIALASGIDIFTLSKLMTHSDLRTTEVYSHILDETRAKAVLSLPRL